MRLVELTGAPGAGKTTLQPLIVDDLRRRGWVSATDESAVRTCVGRSRLGQVAVRLFGENRAVAFMTLVVFGTGSILLRPDLAARVAAAVAGAPVPLRHRLVLVQRYLRTAGRDCLLRRHLRAGEVVIVDEGLIHRSVNLFAWQTQLREADVQAYARRIRAPDVVVVVTADPQLASSRLTARGLPERLRDRDAQFIEAFLARARNVLDVAVETIEQRTAVVRVSNDRGEGRVRELIAKALPSRRECHSTPRYRPSLPIDLPRPDRWRPRRSVAARGSSELAADVLAELGLRATSAPYRLPGGRSSVLLVSTARGSVVLKRYKESVDEAAIVGEHEVLGELARHGFPSPRLVVAPNGESVVRRGAQRFAAFWALEGYRAAHRVLALPGGGRRLSHDAGAALAALHSVLAGFSPSAAHKDGFESLTGSRRRPLEWYLGQLSSTAELPPAGMLFRSHVAERLKASSDLLNAARPVRTVIHGDYGPYNLLVRRGEPIVLVDFELARVDWRLVDLAAALPRFAASRAGFSRRRAQALLDGYQECSAVTSDELALMPAVLEFLSLRRAIVCVSRYRGSRDRRWLREAYAKLRLADELVARRHPIARITFQ